MKVQVAKCILAGFFLSASINVNSLASSHRAVRQVTSSSCQVIPVKVGIGRTTQVVLEQAPKTTLHADKKHFKIISDPSSPRSLAIIPTIDGTDLEMLRIPERTLRSPPALAAALNKSFKTNLFVFFEHNNQLIFEIQIVEKDRADNILKVTQTFNSECEL